MANNSDNNDGGPIIGLYRKQIIEAWNQRKSLKQIAKEIPVPIQEINKYLKEIEKAVIQPGGKSHARKDISTRL